MLLRYSISFLYDVNYYVTVKIFIQVVFHLPHAAMHFYLLQSNNVITQSVRLKSAKVPIVRSSPLLIFVHYTSIFHALVMAERETKIKGRAGCHLRPPFIYFQDARSAVRRLEKYLKGNCIDQRAMWSTKIRWCHQSQSYFQT